MNENKYIEIYNEGYVKGYSDGWKDLADNLKSDLCEYIKMYFPCNHNAKKTETLSGFEGE